jgi:hypothetical protein
MFMHLCWLNQPFSVAHLDFQRAFWPMRGKWAASRPAAVVFHGERSKGQK